ncbi:MAG: oligosaccharide flippase family protein [Candidatus Omnitrophota bacterium]
MRKLYKATAVMGTATFVAMVAGLLRAKFTAVMLGPSGMGIFAQALTFTQSTEALCGLSISLGITKYVAEAWKGRNLEDTKGVLTAFFMLQGLAFGALFIAVLIFLKPVSRFVFGTDAYAWGMILVLSAVIFSVLQVSVESAFLGFGRPGIFTKIRVPFYLLGLGFMAVFILAAGLKGVFWYIFTAYLSGFIIAIGFLKRFLAREAGISLFDLRACVKWQVLRQWAGRLLSYGAVMFVSSVLTWMSILFVRSLLIRYEHAEANGYYQVVFALVSYYSPFFTNGLWGYLFPKLSAISDPASFNIEINKAVKFILTFLVPCAAGIFLFKRAFVILVFSSEFLPSLGLFRLYLIGSMFYIMTYLFASTLLAGKRLRAYTLINIAQNALFAGAFAVLVKTFHLTAVAAAYAGANIVSACLYFLYLRRQMGFSFSRENINLLAAGCALTVFVFFVPFESAGWVALKAALIAGWFAFSLRKKRERLLLVSFMRVK